MTLLPACRSADASGFYGVVAADHQLASEAGARILSQGGNAVDAAVATSLALSVVRPDSCGIGGGGFMVIHLPTDPTHGFVNAALNYRETSPAAIGPDSYAAWDPEDSQRGGRAIATPGTVAGLLHALEQYGTLDRQTVFAPAIELAERGFPADAHHVRTARLVSDRFEDNWSWQERFPFVWERLLARGTLQVGDTITLPEQAKALRLIAEQGSDAFYQGPIAQAIVDSIAGDAGVLTKDDLAGYRVRVLEPIAVDLDGRTLLVMPPPSSGGVAVAQILWLVQRLNASISRRGWPEADAIHVMAESFKHAFADRSRFMADSDFVPVPVDQMLQTSNLERMASVVDPNQTLPHDAYGLADPLPIDGGTSHLSVVDRFGGAVACTETINLSFGSLVEAQGYGFLLNDQMDDFTTRRGEANAYGLVQSDANLPEPGKRPLSSMSPTILLDRDGSVLAVAGASGGPRIITSTAQALLRVLAADASAQQAVAAPRIHHQWSPDRLLLESREPIGDETGSVLRDKGHDLGTHRSIGVVQLVRRQPGDGWQAASDPRKGGKPAWARP